MFLRPDGMPIAGDYDQLQLQYDGQRRALWYILDPHHRPCFNGGLLRELRSFQDDLVRANETAMAMGEIPPVRYTILASAVPGVFNLGGDLELFAKLIRAQDRSGLLRYATACIDVLYPNAVGYHQPVTTVTLVQGDALAGGFEAAISSNIVIAERSARFGLPEVLFNLIPGMGAYSFLVRRVSPDVARELIMSGKVLTADEMMDLHLVDLVVNDGEGVDAVNDYLARFHKRANAHAALERVRQLVDPVTYEELIAITRIWVDAALKLSERDLKMIARIVQAQDRALARQNRLEAMEAAE